MSQFFRGFRKPSKRDDAIAFNAADRFYAGAANKVAEQRIIKPLRIRRPVDGKAPQPSEHQVQAAVISWWFLAHAGYGLPVFALFAVPNGGARDAITGSLLKAEGVRRGTPDLLLAVPNRKYHGLLQELKTGDNKPSDEQKAFIAYLTSAGYKASVHWGADSAIEEIKSYLIFDETMALIP